MLTQRLPTLSAWTGHFVRTPLPVLKSTSAALAAMAEDQDRINAQDIAAVVMADPLMAMRVLASLAAVRRPQQVGEVTTIEAYVTRILRTLADNGVTMIRLDAVGYAIKRAGRSSVMMPETLQFIDALAAEAKALGFTVLVEVHSHYRTQIDIAKRVDYVYDFALPLLVLHSLFFNTHRCLVDWLKVRPHNAFTVLDTHDGIGVIDVGADLTTREANPGLLPPAELAALVDRVHDNCGGQSRQATGSAAPNLDLYQVNCTFYDALARQDTAYLMARAIQFFVPGIPQVYYVGLLAGSNDMALLAKTGVGRDINRRYYSPEDVDAALTRPVVQDLLALIRLRNTPAAIAGQFAYAAEGTSRLTLTWTNGDAVAELALDLAATTYTLRHTAGSTWETFLPLSANPKTARQSA